MSGYTSCVKLKGSPFQKIQIFFTPKTAHMYYQWFFWFTTTNGKGKEIVSVHAKFLNTPIIKNWSKGWHLNLTRISCLWYLVWKLSESTPLFQSRILFAEEAGRLCLAWIEGQKLKKTLIILSLLTWYHFSSFKVFSNSCRRNQSKICWSVEASFEMKRDSAHSNENHQLFIDHFSFAENKIGVTILWLTYKTPRGLK
jgi:hypothetical protein